MKRLASRLSFALLVALISAEAFLQGASWVARTTSARGSAEHAEALGDGTIRILCVGDSHTYGLPLPQSDSYPSQLEVALRERWAGRSFEVVNLGIPGSNSGYAANRLARQMLQLQPQLVIVWVGINNRWNVVESRSAAAAAEDLSRRVRRALLHSRLFRLASIAWYTRTGFQYHPEQHGGWFEGELPPSGRRPPHTLEPDDVAPGLEDDIGRMTAIARSLDTPILFITYPMRSQRDVNAVIAKAAFENGAPVIDGNGAFERAVRSGVAIRDLIDLRAGPHPTARLYRRIIDALLPQVEEALALGNR